MKKSLKYFFFALIFGSALSVASANGQVLSEILRRMDATNKSLTSVQANIQMFKWDAALNTPDPLSVGTTKYLPRQPLTKGQIYARIDWVKPREEHLVVQGEKFELWQPKLQQVIFGTTQSKGGAGNALSFMNMSREQLRANYDIAFMGDENLKDGAGTLTGHLQLTPKARTSYKLADLWVDANGMPRQVRITENNNDTTTVLLSDIRQNQTIKANEFQLNAPKGTKRVAA